MGPLVSYTATRNFFVHALIISLELLRVAPLQPAPRFETSLEQNLLIDANQYGLPYGLPIPQL
jgi:hypothetical protein